MSRNVIEELGDVGEVERNVFLDRSHLEEGREMVCVCGCGWGGGGLGVVIHTTTLDKEELIGTYNCHELYSQYSNRVGKDGFTYMYRHARHVLPNRTYKTLRNIINLISRPPSLHDPTLNVVPSPSSDHTRQ